MKQCVDLLSGINSLICVTTFDYFMVIAALLPEHNPSQNLHSEQQLLMMLYVAFLYSVELYNCVYQQSNWEKRLLLSRLIMFRSHIYWKNYCVSNIYVFIKLQW